MESTVDGSCYLLIRERTYNGKDLLTLLAELRIERVTGTMTIDFSQGGINRVKVREVQDIKYEAK